MCHNMNCMPQWHNGCHFVSFEMYLYMSGAKFEEYRSPFSRDTMYCICGSVFIVLFGKLMMSSLS